MVENRPTDDFACILLTYGLLAVLVFDWPMIRSTVSHELNLDVGRTETMNDDSILKSVQRLSAFTRDGRGGNPAGVWIGSELPTPEIMQSTATNVGYSETVFVSPETTGRTGGSNWRVRYFAPESEVDFCGHATIALGAALAESEGDGTFDLLLNSAQISVTGKMLDTHATASLQSPPTHSNLAAEELIDQICLMFDYEIGRFQ